MTLKERSQLVELLIQHRLRDPKRMQEASQKIDNLRRKTRGEGSVEIIRRFRGKI